MSSSRFNSHFNMIGLNEKVQHKARFWTSYVRALKGTEDIRADDNSLKRNRELSQQPKELRSRPLYEQSPDLYPKIFDEMPTSWSGSVEPGVRIKAPGYRYVPVSQDTYGSGPRVHGSAFNTVPPPIRRSGMTRARW